MVTSTHPPSALTPHARDHFYRIFDRALALKYTQDYIARQQRHKRLKHQNAKARCASAPATIPDHFVLPKKQESRSQALRESDRTNISSAGELLKPRMDVYSTVNSRTTVYIELPGVKREDISLQRRNDGRLAVIGERKCPFVRPVPPPRSESPELEEGAEGEREHQHEARIPSQEIRYGRFLRILPTSINVKQSDIHATFLDGMLLVSWPTSSPGSDPKSDPVKDVDAMNTEPDLQTEARVHNDPTKGE